MGGLVSTRMVLSPDPAWRGIAGRARRTPTGPMLAIVVAGAALGMGAVVTVGGMVDDESSGSNMVAPASAQAPPTGRATPSADPTHIARATPTNAPSNVSTSTPGPSATPSVTPAPTIAPTASPAPAQETYVVEAGDTLAEIAERFATTASALQAANGIDDANDIAIGQVLVIP
ncbi:MAG: LysM peptidoglycan-binding domain-containing protein [Chloroflexota bacterium]|nr:LysM peptidoglycan-binding domain-containing protein [Chloroflexota bacterium]